MRNFPHQTVFSLKLSALGNHAAQRLQRIALLLTQWSDVARGRPGNQEEFAHIAFYLSLLSFPQKLRF